MECSGSALLKPGILPILRRTIPQCTLFWSSLRSRRSTSRSSRNAACQGSLRKSRNARWIISKRSGIHAVLPTAVVEQGKIYNSGFWFTGEQVHRFHKVGLTESEKKFFSVPVASTNKVFEIKGYRCALLICMEAQQAAYSHFKAGDVDLILWPGYWGWTQVDNWSAISSDAEPNLVHKNMTSWKMPLIQSNFACNHSDDYRKKGPEGLSVVVDAENTLRYRGEHRQEKGFIATIDREFAPTKFRDCVPF